MASDVELGENIGGGQRQLVIRRVRAEGAVEKPEMAAARELADRASKDAGAMWGPCVAVLKEQLAAHVHPYGGTVSVMLGADRGIKSLIFSGSNDEKVAKSFRALSEQDRGTLHQVPHVDTWACEAHVLHRASDESKEVVLSLKCTLSLLLVLSAMADVFDDPGTKAEQPAEGTSEWNQCMQRYFNSFGFSWLHMFPLDNPKVIKRDHKTVAVAKAYLDRLKSWPAMLHCCADESMKVLSGSIGDAHVMLSHSVAHYGQYGLHRLRAFNTRTIVISLHLPVDLFQSSFPLYASEYNDALPLFNSNSKFVFAALRDAANRDAKRSKGFSYPMSLTTCVYVCDDAPEDENLSDEYLHHTAACKQCLPLCDTFPTMLNPLLTMCPVIA